MQDEFFLKLSFVRYFQNRFPEAQTCGTFFEMPWTVLIIWSITITSSRGYFATGPCPVKPPSELTIGYGLIYFQIEVLIPFTFNSNSNLFKVQNNYCHIAALTQLEVLNEDFSCHLLKGNLTKQRNGAYSVSDLGKCPEIQKETIYIWQFNFHRMIFYSCYEINDGHDIALMLLISNYSMENLSSDFMNNHLDGQLRNIIRETRGKVNYCQKDTCRLECSLLSWNHYLVFAPFVIVLMGIIFSELSSLRSWI